MAGNIFLFHAVVPLLGMVQAKIVRDKQPCMWVFSESVPFWVGSRRGPKKSSAFCEAVLPELGQTSSYACGLSVGLSLSGFGFLRSCAGGFSCRLSVRLSWRVPEEAVGFLCGRIGGRPAPNREGLGGSSWGATLVGRAGKTLRFGVYTFTTPWEVPVGPAGMVPVA